MVTFTARRSEPELVRPARPTPVETKALSDLDDQWSLRFYESIVGFFRAPPGEAPRPGKVARGIKAAVAAALVLPAGAEGASPGLSPSLKNFLLSIVSGGVVFAGIAGAVVAVSNFDPVKRT